MGKIKEQRLKNIKSIQGLNLPNILDVYNFENKFLGHAYMYSDGKIVALWEPTLKVYDNPSELRDKLIKKNKSTYTCFYFQGKSLKDHGV